MIVVWMRNKLAHEARFDEGDDESLSPPDQPFIEVHPLGRVENCYRWAGETDVFEAIKDVAKRYKIDEKRIVLRGFSMGAAGAWHLGIHFPDRWITLESGAGAVARHPPIRFVSRRALSRVGMVLA